MNPDPSSLSADPGARSPGKHRGVLRWIAGILVIGALFTALRFLPVGEYLNQFNAWVAGLGAPGYFLFILVYIVAAVLFIPGSVLTLGAGFAFGLLWGTVAVSLAATTAAALAFLIARYLLREKFEARIAGNPKFSAVDRAIGQEGGKIVFLLRLTPVMPFSLGNYLFGLTAVKFWPYTLASWVGMIPGTLLYVYLGALGKTGLETASGAADTGRLVVQALALAAIVGVTVVITRVARKALREVEGDNELVP
jgi:uncharacterized membrane protein YdjX (TVP38/TMEM64 family)